MCHAHLVTDSPVLRDATPARFKVGRRGTPDPENSRYYVLDVVNDYQARAQLQGLIRAYRLYGSSVAADELEKLLADTLQDHKAMVAARLARASKKLGGKSTRRRR